MSRRKRRLRTVGFGCIAICVAGFGFVEFTGLGHTVSTLWSHGFFDPYIHPEEDRKYNASSIGNLKELYTAMMLYHESEGQFPMSNGWMDAIENRSVTSDMTKKESDKKFVSPTLAGKTGEYGYAMNDAASGKYKGDIKDPKMPLIFDSSDTSRNAHGDPKVLLPKPARAGGNMGIAVDGTVLKL